MEIVPVVDLYSIQIYIYNTIIQNNAFRQFKKSTNNKCEHNTRLQADC